VLFYNKFRNIIINYFFLISINKIIQKTKQKNTKIIQNQIQKYLFFQFYKNNNTYIKNQLKN